MNKAATTRHTLLQKAFDIIYKKGYQASSVDEILASTKVTKGAFYYHFKNKEEMGLAMIKEIIKPIIEKDFIIPLKNANDSLESLYEMTASLLLDNTYLTREHGCPASNLIQEMVPRNTAFAKALHTIIQNWQNAIVQSIQGEIESGAIRQDSDAEQVANYVIAGYWGVRNLAKLSNNNSSYDIYLAGLKVYLSSLRKD